MSIVISGAMVMAIFLLVAMLTFSTVLGTTTTQGTSLREASDLRVGQVTGTIFITSATAIASGDGSNVTVTADNTGAISYANWSELDLLTKYTNSTGDQEVKRLDYTCKQLCGDSGGPGDNQWTVSSLSPDSYNPKMWDPDETAIIDLRLVPAAGAGTQGTVAVVVPGGVSDSAYFTNQVPEDK